MATPSASVDTEPMVLDGAQGAVAFLTLNRPAQYNALSEEMLAALEAALECAGRRCLGARGGIGRCRQSLLRGPRSEADEGECRDLAYYRRLFDDCSRLMMRIQSLPQPVIARVHGIATAAGCQLVATCDLAVAADDARFAVSGINVGLFCATPSVALSRNVGRKAAFEMLVTGEFIDAPAALQRGLINRCVPAERLDEEIGRLAAAIAAKPPSVDCGWQGVVLSAAGSGVAAAYRAGGRGHGRAI